MKSKFIVRITGAGAIVSSRGKHTFCRATAKKIAYEFAKRFNQPTEIEEVYCG
jgi:hypothetical protein